MVTWWLKGQAQRRDSLTGISLNRPPHGTSNNHSNSSMMSLITKNPKRQASSKATTPSGRGRPLSVTKLPSHDSDYFPRSPTRVSPNYQSVKTRARPRSFTKIPSTDSDCNIRSPSRFSPNVVATTTLMSKIPSQESEVSLTAVSPPRFVSLNASDLTKKKLLSFNKMPSHEGDNSQATSEDLEDSPLTLPGYVVVEDLH